MEVMLATADPSTKEGRELIKKLKEMMVPHPSTARISLETDVDGHQLNLRDGFYILEDHEVVCGRVHGGHVVAISSPSRALIPA